MADDLDIFEFRRRLFSNLDNSTEVTLADLQTLEANRKALVAEYGEDRVRAMHEELTSLYGAAEEIIDEHLASGDQQDKNDE